MIACHHQRPNGFTLVELIVVIAILATLAALAVGAYSRIQQGKDQSATETTLAKINSILDVRYAAVVDQARKLPIPSPLLTYCDNDNDRARVVLIYAHLTVNFPTTKAEASADIVIDPDGAGPLPPLTIARHLKAFDMVAEAGTPEQQSAACLYAALTGTSDAGAAGLDQIVVNTPAGRAFADAWGTPIAFTRLTYAAELDSPPWSKGTAPSKDPVDPLGRLVPGWTNLGDFWSKVAGKHLNYSGFPATYPGPGRNWVMSAISAGYDGEFNTEFNTLLTDPTNLLSFRLRREGQKAGN